MDSANFAPSWVRAQQRSEFSEPEPPEITLTPAVSEVGQHGIPKEGGPTGASSDCLHWSPDSVSDSLLSPAPSPSVPKDARADQVQRGCALAPFGPPHLVRPPDIGIMGDVGGDVGDVGEPSLRPSNGRRRRVSRISADDEALQGAVESLGSVHDADLGALYASAVPGVNRTGHHGDERSRSLPTLRRWGADCPSKPGIRAPASQISKSVHPAASLNPARQPKARGETSDISPTSSPRPLLVRSSDSIQIGGEMPPTSSQLSFPQVQRSSKSLPDLAALEAALAERQASLLTGAAAAEEAGPAPQPDGPTRQFDPTLSRITGFLIDLDGTVYRPNSLIAGACTFHEWLVSTGKQFVYLSNTGAKSSDAVRRKLRTPRYFLSTEKLPPHCVWTAADAQVEFMADHIPVGAKVFVVSGASGDFWLALLRERCPELVDTWEVRTALTETEAKHWATIAAAHPKTPLVWVVMFIDGPLGGCDDPTTGEPSPADWSYNFIRNLTYLLGHGAHLAYTADDSSNPAVDDSYGGYVWPQPGPGMFAAMLKAIIPPRGMGRVHCLGKGGQDGKQYMMEHAIKLLREQGHSGDRKTICMVGDRFDTDIRGGSMVGITTCLVETGAHAFTMQGDYPQDVPTFVARSIGAMHGLYHASPRCELPMVLRQPLRLWVLSNANVTTAHAVDRGLSLQLDRCLKEFYERESCSSSGGFGRNSLLKAFDEIGLEVSEHQVDLGLKTMLLDVAVGPIPYSLFALLIQKALRSVGVDTRPDPNERIPKFLAERHGSVRLRSTLRPIPQRPSLPLGPLSRSLGRASSFNSHGGDSAGGDAANPSNGSAADVEELRGSELAPSSSSRGLLLCDSSADDSSMGSLPFRRSSCGKMSTVDHLRIDLSVMDQSTRHSSKSPDMVGSLRALLRRRKSLGVNVCASFSPWGVDKVGFKSEYRSKAEPTEKNDEPPCEAEPTENKGCLEEEVHVPPGFELVGTGLPPPLYPRTPDSCLCGGAS